MTTQLSLLPERAPPPKATKPVKPKPPPDPVKQALWSEGLYNLASLLGLRNPAARKLLGRLCGAAKRDHAALTELIARAVELRPDEPVSWLVAGARKIGGGGDDDDWGLGAFYLASAVRPDGAVMWIDDFFPEDVDRVLEASGLPREWRGSLAPLAAWLTDGYSLDSIAEVMIAAPGGAHDWKAGPVYTLRFWDGIVRRRASRWCPHRAEWRVGP